MKISLCSILQDLTNGKHKEKIRLDKYLHDFFSEYSRAFIQDLIKTGHVTINGKIEKQRSYQLTNADEIELNLLPAPRKVNILVPQQNIDINIVYEDNDVLVINKQAGLTVHPGAGNHNDTLVNALIAKYGDSLPGIKQEQRPGIVHRLDRDTTGLMLVAKSDIAMTSLSEQIAYREVERIYHALVWNKPSLNIGKIELAIARSSSDRTKMAVAQRNAKPAITHYKLIKDFFNGAISLLECKLETGRTHQIRVHMEHKKMPLLGDKTYSGNPNYQKKGRIPQDILKKIESFPRQCLHAKKISFYHPISEEPMSFEVDYPEDFSNILHCFKS